MALIKCKDCGADVSLSAKTCPRCGAPVPKPKPVVSNAALIVVPLLFVAISVVVAPFLPKTPPDPAIEEKRAARKAIEICWGAQQRKSLAPETQRFIAGACEQLEDDFIRKYGHKP